MIGCIAIDLTVRVHVFMLVGIVPRINTHPDVVEPRIICCCLAMQQLSYIKYKAPTKKISPPSVALSLVELLQAPQQVGPPSPLGGHDSFPPALLPSFSLQLVHWHWRAHLKVSLFT